MRDVRSGNEAEAIPPGLQDIVGRQGSRGADRKVVHAYHSADESPGRLSRGCHLEPMVEGSTFIRFEVAEGDVTELGTVDQPGGGFVQKREHASETGVE